MESIIIIIIFLIQEQFKYGDSEAEQCTLYVFLYIFFHI